MKHTHNWCDHPPDGKLSYDKTWDERYCDTEAIAENKEANSSEYFEDLLYTLEVDPHMKGHPDFWPDFTEWCSECKKTQTYETSDEYEGEEIGEDKKGGGRSDREDHGDI